MPDNDKIICDERLSHIAFIMDGNGRWAKERNKSREYGHKEGAQTFRRIVRYCGDIGIKCATFYAFSTENWKRSKTEVSAIMSLLSAYIDDAFESFEKDKVRVVFIGDMSKIPDSIVEKAKKLEKVTENFSLRVNIAMNYGGRAEIVNAVNMLIASGKKKVDENDIAWALYTKGCSDPDLIVRTAGEERLSNFLLWQSAYSELYFTDKYWPDMTSDDVDAAVREFYKRVRRFGKA